MYDSNILSQTVGSDTAVPFSTVYRLPISMLYRVKEGTSVSTLAVWDGTPDEGREKDYFPRLTG